MTGETPPRRTVKATETVFEIIEFLDADSLSGVTDIASALDLAPSTVHKHLTTLVAQEYVIKEDRQYRLGFRFYEQGQKVRRASPLAQIAEDPIEELANTTGEVVWVFVEEHGYAVHLLKAVGDHGVQTHGELGKRSQLHHLASGKAILAHLPQERVDEILDGDTLPAKTENTVTDVDELTEELATVRERGYAFNTEETVLGLQTVGAPILKDRRDVVGAVSVCGPATRMQGARLESDIPEALLRTTNQIELQLSY
ncbi:IclR family transcriptional regulator [Halomicroarcula sp. GCM10025324]|uniref:IclR family transcriptional regulator n=1 Tax=Haloarcula TaxID=2237 RepID=UPI0023E7AD44|nr:IclR family transcriptional regulator [Halomicroarcula sp. ZS-22-S1]